LRLLKQSQQEETKSRQGDAAKGAATGTQAREAIGCITSSNFVSKSKKCNSPKHASIGGPCKHQRHRRHGKQVMISEQGKEIKRRMQKQHTFGASMHFSSWSLLNACWVTLGSCLSFELSFEFQLSLTVLSACNKRSP
jgi:hypothetical protein